MFESWKSPESIGSAMFPMTAIGTGSQLAGGYMDYKGQQEANEANLTSARETNAANAANVDKQIKFQERMSSTAHQREVQDLIKAGINPLNTTGGNGSSTPAGASATAVPAHVDN